MKDTVTISIDRYNELRDAELSLIEVVKDYDQIYYHKIGDSIGYWYEIKSSDSEIIEITESLKDMCSQRDIAQNENNELKNIIESLHIKIDKLNYKLNIPWYNIPWCKRIFKS